MVEGVNSTMIYLIYCKNFVNATMYPHPTQEERKRKENLLFRVLLLFSCKSDHLITEMLVKSLHKCPDIF
jgi:hypothetical protein